MPIPLGTLMYRLLRFYWRWWKPTVLGARALVIKDGQVLLVRLSYTEGWHLPGGGVKRGESFRSAIVRELQEECGLLARDPQLFGLYHSTKTGKIDHIAIFVVNRFETFPNARPDPEIAELRYFGLRGIPADATPATKRRAHEYLNGLDGVDQW